MVQLHTLSRLRLGRRILPLVCGLLLATALWAQAQQMQLAENIVRLHVLANSDSTDDQALKLVVRDRILLETDALLAGQTDAAGAHAVLQTHLSDLAQCAARTVHDQGYPYSVAVKLEPDWFPTRQYDTFSLPAGTYDALRVVIGSGAGHNWWCVVFPPLCLSSVSETTVETAGMTGEDYRLVTESDQSYVIKFKIVELWEQWKHTAFSS